MRVLQINAVYEKFSTGRLVKQLHEMLLQKGVDSYVACPNLNGLKDNSFQIGNPLDWKAHAILSRLTGKQGYFSKEATRRLLEYMDAVKPDIVHLHNLHNNYLNLPLLFRYLKEHQIAVVVTLHDCWCFTGKCMYFIEYNCSKWREHCGACPAKKTGNKSFFFDFSRRLLHDKAKWFSSIERLAVVGVSKWVTEDARHSILKSATVTECIYNWIDLNSFQPRDCMRLRFNLGVNDKFIILGIAVSWSPLKGSHVFHALANLLPEDCQIILIGDASNINEKHSGIRYLGTINDTRLLAKYYSMADVFLNPTVQETFGMTTAEAMACGTPVVAYNGTATPELVGTDGSCGYLVNENTAEQYYKRVMQIKQRTKAFYSDAARSRAIQMFSKKHNIQEYMNVYQKLLNNKAE